MGRMEILTGRERRRVWSDAQKLSILEEVADGDLPVSQVARRHDILPQQIYAWRRKFMQPAEAGTSSDMTTFLPVAVVPPVQPEGSCGDGKKKFSTRQPPSVEIRCKGGC